MRQTIRMIVWLILASLFITCGSRGESDNSDSSEELIENEIWNPLIILSREESRIVAAKAEKLYKSSNDLALLVGSVEVDFFNEEGNHMINNERLLVVNIQCC